MQDTKRYGIVASMTYFGNVIQIFVLIPKLSKHVNASVLIQVNNRMDLLRRNERKNASSRRFSDESNDLLRRQHSVRRKPIDHDSDKNF